MARTFSLHHIAVFLLIGLSVIVGFLTLNSSYARSFSYPTETLQEGFSIRKNGTLLDCDRPEDAMDAPAAKGDVYELEVTLPAEVPSAALKVYSMHAILDCYLDDYLLYSYGVSYLERNDFIPQGYHLILLPPSYGGKTLRLQFTATEKNAFFSITPPVVGNVSDLITGWVRDVRIVVFVGVFLVLFGFLMAAVSLLMHLFEERNLQMFAGGLVAMNLGLFALCYYNAFFFITPDLWWSTMIEYYAQFFLPVTIIAFMRMTTTDRRIRMVFTGCLALSVVMLVSAALLQLTRLYPITQSIIIFQRVAILLGIIVVYYGLQILRRRILQYLRIRSSTASVSGGLDLSSNMYLITGIFVVLFAILFDVTGYQITRYTLNIDSTSTHSVSLLGMAVYAMFMMLSYFYHGVSITYDRSQSRRLEELAYTDALTSLPNRAYCRRVLDELEAQGRGYCVISMDVNYLKEVNDTRGHAAGDELLKNFADVLRASFRSSDIVGRLSGDEFIAILRGASLAECQDKVRQMALRLPFSISYGCAHSSECPTKSAQDVYRLADSRMYEMKQEVHIAHT